MPGNPIPIAGLAIDDDLRAKLPGIGQEFTFGSDDDSTGMSIMAAQAAIETANISPSDIALVITAPTLITAHGLEIPAIALRAALGLGNAECLNVTQGCVGFLSGLQLASQFLAATGSAAHILVVTACKASTLMENFNHGAFFWADAAAAAVVTGGCGQGLRLRAYGEKSSDRDWGAMRLVHGDARPYAAADPAKDLKLVVEFEDPRSQMDYILGEQTRCDGLISALLEATDIDAAEIDGVFLPSIGANRVPHLLRVHKNLRERVRTDFRYAHMGGVDAPFFLHQFMKNNPPRATANYIAITPAYTAQWGGVLLTAEV